MHRHVVSITLSFLLYALLFSPTVEAQTMSPEKGVATGTVMVQGYSFVGDPGKMTFYNVGGLLADSTYNDAYLTTDDGKVYLKGTFSGGPNGVASFSTLEGLDFNVPLQNGRTFYLKIPGIIVDLTVTDSSIFEPDEEVVPEPVDDSEKPVDSGTRASDLSGQVEIACPPDLDAWDVMKMGRVIYVNCHIRTGEDSSAELSFSDMTTFKMKPESEIVIDTPPQKDSKIKLLMGKIWVNVKKMVKDGTMEVHGSQAVAGIKGTTLILEEKNGTSTIKVIEGTVHYTSISTGKSSLVRSGEMVRAERTGLQEMQKFDVGTESQQWEGIPQNKTEPIKTDQKIDRGNFNIFLSGGIILILLVGILAIRVVMKQKK
jgi:hypothetical protein